MNIFKDRFSEIKKASEPLYKSPKSVQETIEIQKISESGIFEELLRVWLANLAMIRLQSF